MRAKRKAFFSAGVVDEALFERTLHLKQPEFLKVFDVAGMEAFHAVSF